MFFKNNNQKDTKNADLACWITFTFWGGILFLNSFFEKILKKTFIDSSFVILAFGLVIFFTSYIISNLIRQQKQ